MTSDAENADALYYHGLIARDLGERIEAVGAFVQVRKRDLADLGPPWEENFGAIDSLVERAIGLLEERLRAMLQDVEICIEPYPSEAQVRAEMDPRQVVFIERVDPQRGVFEKMWVFHKNIVRAGIMPGTAEQDLALLIEREVLSGRGVL